MGAGAGLIGEYLQLEMPQARYRFIEPIPALERALEQRFGTQANARHADRFEGAAAVTLLDVLEHQADDRAFLSGLVDRMERGATLIITVPALQILWSWWDEALGHHRRYDIPTLARTISRLPVTIEEISYLFPELLPAALVRRIWRTGNRETIDEAALPRLPRHLNEVLYRIGSLSLRARSFWPAGSSLFAVLRRR